MNRPEIPTEVKQALRLLDYVGQHEGLDLGVAFFFVNVNGQTALVSLSPDRHSAADRARIMEAIWKATGRARPLIL